MGEHGRGPSKKEAEAKAQGSLCLGLEVRIHVVGCGEPLMGVYGEEKDEQTMIECAEWLWVRTRGRERMDG